MVTVSENNEGLVSHSGLAQGARRLEEKYNSGKENGRQLLSKYYFFQASNAADAAARKTSGTRSTLAENVKQYYALQKTKEA